MSDARILYKFMPYDTLRLQSLIQGYFWFSQISDLNDPWEHQLKWPTQMTFDDFKAFVSHISQLNGHKRREEAIKAILAVAKQSADDQNETLNMQLVKWKENFRELLERPLIFSASAAWNNPLMWAHYCNGHTGFCLGFDSAEILLGEHADDAWYEMTYSDSRVDVIEEIHGNKSPSIEDTDNMVGKALVTKAHWWNYEREYRKLDWEPSKENKIEINYSGLKEVLFGLKVSDESVQTIKSILGIKNPDICYYKVALSKYNNSFLFDRELV
ncbi:DUF2971 domain-containing protein [Saccharospirillum alexandrii]|uniref:DUF2971 domain-containing protein n=1 Tax=Saccharospirillum alexandrii TaxID=2448477 RepID=UPI0037351725